jgi:hypothetical protein
MRWVAIGHSAAFGLFFLHTRSNGLNDHRSHPEGITAIFDVVPSRNPIEISAQTSPFAS